MNNPRLDARILGNIRLSLDCNGVIADTYRFFEETIQDRLGISLDTNFFSAASTENFYEYESERHLKEGSIIKFLKSYDVILYKNMENLKPIPNAVESINMLLRKDIDRIVINTYRPSKYKSISKNMKILTLDWLKRNGIVIHPEQVNVAETYELKLRNIFKSLNANPSPYSSSRVMTLAHIDDDMFMLNKLHNLSDNEMYVSPYTPSNSITYNIEKILLYNDYSSNMRNPLNLSEDNIYQFYTAENWRDIPKILSKIGEKKNEANKRQYERKK